MLVVNPPAALEKQLGPVLEELQKSLSKGDFCRAASTSLRMLPKKVGDCIRKRLHVDYESFTHNMTLRMSQAEAATVPGQAVRLQTRLLV